MKKRDSELVQPGDRPETRIKSRRVVWVIAFAGLAIVAAIIAIILARQNIQTISDAELRARYATGQSEFIDMDGVPIHIRDEGEGHPVILLHGSYGSLRMWDAWADRLKQSHRVIRFDIPPIGLSGPDPKDRYGYPDAVKLLGAVIDKYGFDKVDLAGTSIGGVVAYRFAADNPDKVKRLVLANVPLVPLALSPDDPDLRPWTLRMQIGIGKNLLDGYQTRAHTNAFLKYIFSDDSKVTDELVTEYKDLANRTGNKPRGMIFAKNSRTSSENGRILASIKNETLILWCTENPILTVAHGEAGLSQFRSTKPEFIKIPGCGHILPIEKGDETAELVEEFFNKPLNEQ